MKHAESKLQQACIRWYDLTYPKMKMLLHAVPNGGARSASQGAILKREGVRAGVADLFFAKSKFSMPKENLNGSNFWWDTSNMQLHGLFIEMKIGKGKQTDAQIAFEKAVTEQGYAYKVVRTFDEFKELITNWIA